MLTPRFRHSLLTGSALCLSLVAQAAAPESPAAQAALTRLEAQRESLGLTSAHSFRAVAESREASGQSHVHLRQFYRGVRVWGGDAIFHADATGRALPLTDALQRGVELDPSPSLGASEILAVAHQSLAPEGAYFTPPKTELVVLPLVATVPIAGLNRPASNAMDFVKRNDGFVLAYHVHLEVEDPVKGPIRRDYLIHAHTGEILRSWDTLHTSGATGSGQSQYSGAVSIQTNSTTTGPGFELRDTTRGNTVVRGGTGNVVTDMANSGDTATAYVLGTVYTDADNAWGTGTQYLTSNLTSTPNGQTAAVDAAFGLEKTWDFYKKVLNRDGIDNAGTATIMRVHYRPTGNTTGYDNASWSDGCFCMTFGDGPASTGGAGDTSLTSLDIAGHEMSHGVCSTAVPGGGLDYFGESGGLNEANSDIFGTMVEFYARGGVAGGYTDGTDSIGNSSAANWTIGEQIDPSNTPLRYMYKPSLDASPLGTSPDAWSPTLGNLDVHFSSGPMNRCFYFLSQGATVAGNTSTPLLPAGMTGIGNDKAARIWYRALTTYLTSSSDYAAARAASVRAATDLFGALSPEYVAVQNAFHGINVGVAGDGSTPEDFTAPSVGLPTVTGTQGTVTFSATATDAGGSGMAFVEFYVDGVLAGSSSTGSPYTLAVDSTQFAPNTHTLVARAYDANHNATDSAGRSFSLANPLSQCLLNPGFEQGYAGWTTTSGADLAPAGLSHSGSAAAWLGGWGFAQSDSFDQTVTVPSNPLSVNFSFWLRVSTAETGSIASDTLNVRILSTTGTVLQNLATYSNLDKQTPYAYVQKTFDLTAFKGQTIKVQFAYSEDAQNFTSFRIDDVNLYSSYLDLNSDQGSNLLDLLTFAKHYGATGGVNTGGCDLTGDGAVNDTDLAILLNGL